jgi:hypothetical protein
MSVRAVLDLVKSLLSSPSSTLQLQLKCGVYLALELPRKADGTLTLPTETRQIVIHLITDLPSFEWGVDKGKDVRVQVDAWATVPGDALRMLELAEALLKPHRFIPLPIRSKGVEDGLTGVARDFQKGTA